MNKHDKKLHLACEAIRREPGGFRHALKAGILACQKVGHGDSERALCVLMTLCDAIERGACLPKEHAEPAVRPLVPEGWEWTTTIDTEGEPFQGNLTPGGKGWLMFSWQIAPTDGPHVWAEFFLWARPPQEEA